MATAQKIAHIPIACPEAFAPGDVLEDKYRLDKLLGEGAMGRVWQARNLTLDRPVAIKIVHPELRGREAATRLISEARIAAKLQHPNVVQMLDCHADAKNPYAVMELLEGCTLADLMDEGPLPALFAVRLMLPLLDGLSAAHRLGIVHRDIKPANVFVSAAGDRLCPKLLDFGVALLHRDAAKPRSATRLIVGSLGYMSPEQAFGEHDVDASSDVFSVAVVLYEAISGRCAFDADDYHAYLRELTQCELAPLTGEACAGLWPILSRALAKSRAQRSASAAEFSAALGAWLRARGVREDLSGESLPAEWVAYYHGTAASPLPVRSSAGPRSAEWLARRRTTLRSVSVRSAWNGHSAAALLALAGCGLLLSTDTAATADPGTRGLTSQALRSPMAIAPSKARIAVAQVFTLAPALSAARAVDDKPDAGVAPGNGAVAGRRLTPRVHGAASQSALQQRLRRQAAALGLKNPW